MDAMRMTEMVSLGRKLIGIAVLAGALVSGPLALAAPGDGAEAGAAGCGANAAPATGATAAGIEWSSSPRMPGKPY